ncbi:MAG TPA: hypothetical protein VLT33_48565, partial [Labilithrix sp.]|nr:hypothetical protein [Labilithrix sp.]
KLVAAGGAILVAVLAACATDSTRECRVGADCASGVCGPDGQCIAPGDVPGVDAAGADASTTGDGATPPNDAGGDSALPGCTPNKDGTITRDEVPIAAGLHATYKIGTNEDVSTAGTPGTNGRRNWDFSGALASDASVIVETQPLKGKWYETKFAGATYASKLSQGSDLLGVFETSPGALLLRGVVSPTETAKTELTYTPGVSVLNFPLKLGSMWTTASKVAGTYQYLGTTQTTATPYDEKYESKVSAAGELKTPLGTFEVLRVQVLLTRTIATLVFPFSTTTTVRTFAFVTECYGTIATVTSADNETNEEFTRAAEIRRIAP